MASFKRRCRKCRGTGVVEWDCSDMPGVMEHSPKCEVCHGTGDVEKQISIPCRIAVHNGRPRDFVMIVTPDGRVGFREKKHKTIVWTSAQGCFNRALQEEAAAKLANRKTRRKRWFKRGLLTVGR